MSRSLLVLLSAVLLAACRGAGASEEPPPLVIGGIPDQDLAILEERFEGIAAHLGEELDLPVTYQPSVDYAAVVTGFSNGDIALGWFGGLTGVQARLETPGARAIAQRPIDTAFHSVFIANGSVEADSLADLAGSSFTFGSASSTSGHLMPRYFLSESGIEPERDFPVVGYSGSHDTTWQLVESGTYTAGALNESVWKRAVDEGQVDTATVRVVERTPAYVDYHWLAHPDIDDVYGEGTTEAITAALLRMHESADDDVQRVLELFEDTSFVAADNADYATIEQVARDLGLVGG